MTLTGRGCAEVITSMANIGQKTKAELLAEIQSLRLELAALRAQSHPTNSSDSNDQMLQADAARYPLLVETMNEGVAVQNAAAEIVYVNVALCRMLRCTKQELLGKTPLTFIHPKSHALFEQQMELRRTGHRDTYEIQLCSPEGRIVHVLASPSAILDADGNYCGAFAVYTDLTERRAMEEELTRERSRLRTLMDHIPDSVYVKDARGQFLLANRAKLHALGMQDMAELEGKTVHDLFPPELAKKFDKDDLTVMQRGEALLNLVEQNIGPNQTEIWMLSSKVPITDDAGEVVGLVGISRDITEQRKAEKAVVESECRFREILEHSRDIAYRIHLPSNHFDYISPSVVELTGYTVEEMMQAGPSLFWDQVHPEDQKRVEEYAHILKDVARKQTAAPLCEVRILHKDGEYRWFSENAALIQDQDGGFSTRVGTIRDITKSVQAQEAVRAASRMEATTTLAGGIAHDFNNLMAAVLSNAELLEMNMGNDPENLEMLRSISSAAEHAGDLAQQMLAFARGGKYQPVTVDVNEIIQDILRLEEHSFQPNVTVETMLSPETWNVFADPTQISQVIMNLSINAVEAIEGTGRISIITNNKQVDRIFADLHPGLEPGPYVRIVVQDTGHGMSRDVQRRVFEPFYSTKFQGRGLGLAAVYGIVKNHHGHISVQSEPGVGTTFRIYLPASKERLQPKPKPQTPLPIGHETILVVDDEPLIVEATRQILDRLGYTVLVAANGREALDVLTAAEKPVHLIILDMAMPVMGGAEVFPHIAKGWPKTKVVVCSGYELGPAAQKLLDQGAHAFLQKPCRIQTMACEIRRVLDE